MRLLLVEDEELLRTTLTRDLEGAGFAVDTASDGERGEFLGSTEHYDIVVLDLGLLRLSGLDVLRRWRESEASLPYDRQDLVEQLGNLADKACKWARERVQIGDPRTQRLRHRGVG